MFQKQFVLEKTQRTSFNQTTKTTAQNIKSNLPMFTLITDDVDILVSKLLSLLIIFFSKLIFWVILLFQKLFLNYSPIRNIYLIKLLEVYQLVETFINCYILSLVQNGVLIDT